VAKYSYLISIKFAGETIFPKSTLKYLGVVIDPFLSFNFNCASVAAQLRLTARSIRHIRSCLDVDVASGLAVALGGGRLDYCNSLLVQSSVSNFSMLQKAQNALARAVLGRSLMSSATENLSDLHWLPVPKRICFKLACIMYKVLMTQSPPYLHKLLQPYVPSRSLRSSTQSLFAIPDSRTATAKRRFGYAAPNLWNSLPREIRSAESLVSFRRQLKTYLYNSN
jgi:hypothetical protein